MLNSSPARPFSSVTDINRAAGKVILTDPMGLHFLPTSRLRMTLWSDDNTRRKEIHVQMTPVALNGAPWLIDYELTIPPNGKQQRAEIQDTGISFFTAPLFAGR